MSKLIIFNLKTPDQKKLKFFLYFLVMSKLITLSPQLITSAENIFISLLIITAIYPF